MPTPAPCRWPPRPPRRSSTLASQRPVTRWHRRPSTCRWRPSRTPPGWRCPRPSVTCASTAQATYPDGFAPDRGSARPRARLPTTTTRTHTPGISPRRRCCRTASPAHASTSRTRPRPSWGRACSRSAGRAPRRRDNRTAMTALSSDTSTALGTPLAQARLSAHDPATGALLGTVTLTAPERVEEVVEAVAKVQPLWALLRVKDRARYMGRMAQALIDDFDELQEILGREQGRPRAEIAALELLAAIDALKWIAEDGAGVLGGGRVGIHRSLAIAKRARIAFEPYGVVAVIGAGSAPFAQPLGQIAGALLAGNGVVFKPAARACLAGERIAVLLARAGLPEGLVRVVHGSADVGVALAQSSVSKVLFTGSPAVGRMVARACVSREKEVTVELGGKDAMLVLGDAHLRRAVRGALWAGCAGAGQARGSLERVYVLREVYERFLAGLVSAASALSVGNPADPSIQVGPLASARRAEYLDALVQEALAAGAELRCGGPVSPPGCAAGAFYAPGVITGASSEMRVLREPLDG